jgi:hypothetical protein
MKFMLIHAVDESVVPNEKTCVDVLSLDAWVEDMTVRGIVLDGARLQPVADATTVRTGTGETVVIDGPFAETKEQIAGYDLIECRDLDEALAVAATHPTVNNGAIEVRPFGEGMPTPQVGDEPAEGKRRYLMMVVANTERFIAACEQWKKEKATPIAACDQPDEIDAWLDKVSEIRLYGWELEPTSYSSTVRGHDGRVITLDGPFAETNEQIAGYDLLECTDLDDAIAAAAAHPAGTIEIRPLWFS